MKTLMRILMWAGVGLSVAIAWGLYFATRDKDTPIGPLVDGLSRLTQPAVAVVFYFNPHFPLGLSTVVLENAATYALIGLMIEMIRRRYTALRSSN